MRNFILWMILLIVLAGCAGQKMYYSKGVYYPQKPAKELNALIKPMLPNLDIGSVGTPQPGNLLITSDKIFFPIITYYPKDTAQYCYTVVYAIDKANYGVTDSLILFEPKSRKDYPYLVWDNGFYIIGIQDSTLTITKTTDKLKVQVTNHTNIKADVLMAANVLKDKLRLFVKNADQKVYMYEYVASDLHLERKRLLLNKMDGVKHSVSENKLWLFETKGDKIAATKVDISETEPAAAYLYLNNPCTMADQKDSYSVFALDNAIYLKTWDNNSCSVPKEIGVEIKNTFIYNAQDGKLMHSLQADRPYFNLVKAGPVYYKYTNIWKDAWNIYNLSAVDQNLTKSSPIIDFTVTDFMINGTLTYGREIAYLDGDKIYCVGHQYLMEGKYNRKKVQRLWPAAGSSQTGPLLKMQPFIAVYSLD